MKFSIIIPAHNAENYIRKALDSIKSQSFKDYELIVVCDSCTDKTEFIARQYGAITKNVQYHCDGPTRGVGLDMAQGEWVLFMDDDDWWLHEFVLEQLAERVGRQHEDIFCFAFIWKDIRYCSPASLPGGLYPAVWNKCWRRAFIGNTRFPAVKSISDWYFHTEMMRKNPRIAMWDMPMYYYNYLRPGSISQKQGRTVEETKKQLENM